MIYDLSKDYDRERFKTRSAFLLEKRRIVELTEKTRRSLRQNNYLFLILNVLAMEYGENVEYVKQNIFKRHVNPDIFLTKKQDKILGEVEVLRSSADISKDEMRTAIDRLKIFCAKELGVRLPDSFTYEEQIELMRQMEIHKNYL